jgi:hypothetical protein
LFRRIIIFVCTILILNFGGLSQTQWHEFKKLSYPEKIWVLKHPFVAQRAQDFSQIARKIADSLKTTTLLDGDANGGQVDAFRHAYWMALLCREIGWRKAYRLGKAHEKGNYLDFKKHRLEDGSMPDKPSCDMDLWNNNTGINISLAYRKIDNDSLKIIVINNILQGKMKIIRKTAKGEFLDKNFQIISADSLKGRWENGKVLDNSDKIISK